MAILNMLHGPPKSFKLKQNDHINDTDFVGSEQKQGPRSNFDIGGGKH